MNDRELPVELTSMTPGPLRTALEVYHNTNSGHYERMEAVVAALMAEHAQRAEVETLRRNAERYQWLRDVSTTTWRSFQEQWRMPAAQCDAAIDAAMKDHP